jgi:hypothetical protein
MKRTRNHLLTLGLLVATVLALTSAVSAGGLGRGDRGTHTPQPRIKTRPNAAPITYSSHTIQDQTVPSIHTIQDKGEENGNRRPPDGAQRPGRPPAGFDPEATYPSAFELELALTLQGDVTGDGRVDTRDLIAVLMAWGACPDPNQPCQADLDGNGYVDVEDLVIVMLAMRGL